MKLETTLQHYSSTSYILVKVVICCYTDTVALFSELIFRRAIHYTTYAQLRRRNNEKN